MGVNESGGGRGKQWPPVIRGAPARLTRERVARPSPAARRDDPFVTAARAGNVLLVDAKWDRKGIIYYELLPLGKTINSDFYCQQLMRFEQEGEKTVGNARPHTSLIIQQILRDFGWEVLMHSPYIPDLAPSDYHMFCGFNMTPKRRILSIGLSFSCNVMNKRDSLIERFCLARYARPAADKETLLSMDFPFLMQTFEYRNSGYDSTLSLAVKRHLMRTLASSLCEPSGS
ncbi:Mariner Mos1 transposase [Eumeta japonica]|uniref:Mariner Mos1 transposase n=1 Tax=Eumeta variegata TaxID=151549 RepID=A0A4C1TU10_EUMVA|nr:Mariner Mos1 transposase [Eumeta japonica]